MGGCQLVPLGDSLYRSQCFKQEGRAATPFALSTNARGPLHGQARDARVGASDGPPRSTAPLPSSSEWQTTQGRFSILALDQRSEIRRERREMEKRPKERPVVRCVRGHMAIIRARFYL